VVECERGGEGGVGGGGGGGGGGRGGWGGSVFSASVVKKGRKRNISFFSSSTEKYETTRKKNLRITPTHE
jgi:hypothetical protein